MCGLIFCCSAIGCATPGWLSWKGQADQASPKLQLAWAMLQERDGKLGDARQAYTTVLEQDPKSVDAILGLARLDYLANRLPEAELGFQRAVQFAPKSPQALDALGQFYAEQERWDEASTTLQQAVALAPDERIYRFHLAVTTARSGNIEGSLPHFTQAVGLAEAHYNIGRILYDQGKVAAGEEHFALAVMQNPQLQEAQFWLDEVRQERHTTVVAANRPDAVKNLNTPSAPITANRPTQIAVNPKQTETPHQPIPAQSAQATTPAQNWVATPTSATQPVPAQPASAQPKIGQAGVEQAGGFPTESQMSHSPTWTATPPSVQMPSGLSPAQQEQLENQRRRAEEAAQPR